MDTLSVTFSGKVFRLLNENKCNLLPGVGRGTPYILNIYKI